MASLSQECLGITDFQLKYYYKHSFLAHFVKERKMLLFNRTYIITQLKIFDSHNNYFANKKRCNSV